MDDLWYQMIFKRKSFHIFKDRQTISDIELRNIEENIKNTHLNPSSSIFEEPTNLLKHEVREPAIYNAVITAIATGSSKMNEISNKIDEDTSVCATYIKNLITLGIVKKESPYGKKSTRKTIYSI